eukprot:5038006-Prymnesium_polylepis.1
MPHAGTTGPGTVGGGRHGIRGGRSASATIVIEIAHHGHGHFLVAWLAALEVRPFKCRLHVEDVIVEDVRRRRRRSRR